MQQQTTDVWIIQWNFFGTLFLSNVLRVTLPLVCMSSNAVSEITTAPLGTTAIVGQRVALSCCTNESRPIDWFFTKESQLSDSEYDSRCSPGASHQCIQITSDGVLTEGQDNQFNVSRNNSLNSFHGCSSLSFDVNNMSYAGAYRCYGGYDSKANAFLTVTDLELNVCSQRNSTNGSEELHFECRFFYSGRKLNWALNTSRDPITNCTEEESSDNNYTHTVICKIRFRPQGFHFQDGHISCQFGNHTGRKVDHDSVKAVVTFDSNEGFTVTIRCSNNSSEYKSTTTDFSPNDTDDRPTSKSVMVVVSICAVVGLIIVIICLLIKCDSKRSKSKTGAEITLNEPVYSLVRQNGHDTTTAVCSEVNKKKSSKKTPVYAEVTKNVRKIPEASAAQPDHVIAETGIYGYNLNEDDSNSKTTNIENDCVIYSELRSVGPITVDGAKTEPRLFRIREGFERSDYVSVDHSFRTPPAPPAPPRAHR